MFRTRFSPAVFLRTALKLAALLAATLSWSAPAAAAPIYKATRAPENYVKCVKYAASPESAIDQMLACTNADSELLNYYRDAFQSSQPDGSKTFCVKTYRESDGSLHATCAYTATGTFIVDCVSPQIADYNSGTCTVPPATTGCTAGEQLPGCADSALSREKKQHGNSCPVQDKNPVNAATGNKYQHEVDYTAPTGLAFSRSYNSRSNETGVLGAAWRHQWQAGLTRYDSSAGSYIVATRADGQAYYFTLSSGQWTGETDIRARLTETATGYVLDDGAVRRETYDAQGRLVLVEVGGAQKFTLAYSNGALSTVSDQFGHMLTLVYDAQGRLAMVTGPAGYLLTYGYDTNSNLESVTYPGNTVRTYHYEDGDLTHALTGITDENTDRYATWGYDSENRATLSEHAGGADGGTFEYNADGTTTITDSTGLARTRGFSFSQGTYKAASTTAPGTSCGENSAATTYDANGFVAQRTDFNGNITKYTPNARGLEESRTEAFGTPQARTITTQWHPTFRLPTQIDEPGRRTTYTHDSNGNRLTETTLDTATGASRTTTWTYNALGQMETVNGPRTDVSDVTTYAYYVCTTGAQCGQLHTITNALGQVTTITSYDAHGNPLTIVDPNGVTTTVVFDARLRPKTRTVAGATTTVDYDAAGLLGKVTLPGGAFLEYTYDAAHRLTDVEDSEANKIHYTLDTEGNRTAEEVFDPSSVLARKQSQAFNSLGRLEQVKNAAGAIIAEYAYDAQGNRTSQTDYSTPTTPHLTQFIPDALNRIWKTIDAANGTTETGLNALDQVTSVRDPRLLTTGYTVNALGDVKQQDSPDTGSAVSTHDSAGNLKTRLDARGNLAICEYDALNRVTTVDYPGPGNDVAYTYDGTNYTGSEPNGKGRLTRVSDQSGATTLFYDARGNVTQEQRSTGSTTYVTSYGYDLADRLTSVTYPTGRIVTYSRNTVGQIMQVTTTLFGVTNIVADNITYVPFGAVQGYTLGSGVVVTRHHDTDGRVDEMRDQGTALIQNLIPYYDLRGNVEAVENVMDSSGSWAFDYDAVSRLTGASIPAYTWTYAHDAVGNRSAETTQPAFAMAQTSNYAYPATSNRLSSVTTNSTVLNIAYDAAGNVTSRGPLTLTYNSANRAQTIGSVSNTYSAAGLRAAKTANGQTTVFHYDRQGHLLSETNASDPTLERDYVWLEGLPLALEAVVEPIVDNTDVGFTTVGEWTTSTSVAGYYGTNYRLGEIPSYSLDQSGTGTSATGGPWTLTSDSSGFLGNHGRTCTAGSTYTWRPPATPGDYQVSVRWVSAPTNSNNVTYTVTHSGGTTVYNSNQTAGGGAWSLLGTQTFSATPVIKLAGVAAGCLSADAVMLQRVNAPQTAHFAAPGANTYEVYAWWPASASHSAAVNYTITHASGSAVVAKNQRTGGGAWNLLGTYTFNGTPGQEVKLFSSSSGTVAADAIRFKPTTSSGYLRPTYYYHVDHLGTPQKLTDALQQVVWQASYSPFGAATLEVNKVTQPLRFPGQYFDAETGLHQNWSRDYDPSIGRYLQSDPIGLAGGLNTYAYASNSPQVFIDPMGWATCTPWIAVGYAPDTIRYSQTVGPWSAWEMTNAFHARGGLLTCDYERYRTVTDYMHIDKNLVLERTCDDCGKVTTERKNSVIPDEEGTELRRSQQTDSKTLTEQKPAYMWWQETGARPNGYCAHMRPR